MFMDNIASEFLFFKIFLYQVLFNIVDRILRFLLTISESNDVH